MSKQSPIQVSQDTNNRKHPIGIDESTSNSDNTNSSTNNKSSNAIENEGIALFDPSSNSNPSSPNRSSINIQCDRNLTLSQLTSNTNATNSSSSHSANHINNSILFPVLNESDKNTSALPEYLFNRKNDTISKEEKVKLRSKYICQYDIDDVVIDKEKQTVVSVGNLDTSIITSRMVSDFVKIKLGHGIPTDQRTVKKVFDILYTIKASGSTMNFLIKKQEANMKKKFRPSILKKDGTLFRVINVITSERGRSSFISTRKDFDRVDIDSNQIPHHDYWLHMLSLYNDILSFEYNNLTNFAVTDNSFFKSSLQSDENNPKIFDELTLEEFKSVVEYIIGKYKKTRQKKNVSGMHEPYARFADGKLWLLYLHELLVSIGNQALFDCCFVQLNKDVHLCSTTNIQDDISTSSKSLSPSKKRKTETELLQQKLIESKIESVTAFGNKTRKLERISLSRCLNEVMNEYIALNQNIKKMKKNKNKLKNWKKKENQKELIMIQTKIVMIQILMN